MRPESLPTFLIEVSEAAAEDWIRSFGGRPAEARRAILETAAGRDIAWREDRGVIRVRSRRTQRDVQLRLAWHPPLLVIVAIGVRHYL